MDTREFSIQKTTRPFDFRNPFSGADHALLLCVLDDSITGDERNQLSDKIIAENCRFAVCWGHDCSLWDDSIDWAFLETDANFAPPDNRFVMTTWHEDESIEEAIEFWIDAKSQNFSPAKFGVLIIGSDSGIEANLQVKISKEMQTDEKICEP